MRSELIIFPDVVYRRFGDCDGCASGPVQAACCRYVQVPERDLSGDELHWLALHGLDATVERNVRLEVPCGALTEDGRCSLKGLPDRPLVCDNYPELPGLDPVCSYRFEKVN